jgi:HEAT repeat protein
MKPAPSLRHFVFALAVLGIALSTLSAAERPVSELLSAAKGGSEATRIQAIDELAAKKDKAAPAVSELIALLSDKSTGVRAHAAHALGEIGTAAKPAAETLTSLLKEEDETVRRQAVKALAAIRPGPAVMIPLFVKLMDDTDPGVRQRILHAVAEAGVDAVPGLIQALKDERATYWACLILRDIGPPAKEAVPALADLLKSPQPEIRREAALALGAMREEGTPAIAQLAALLNDKDAQEAATLALGQIGRFPWTAESQIRANAKSDNKVLSTLSLWTLVRLYPARPEYAKDAAEQLITLLTDNDPYVRTMAAKALAGLKLNPDVTFPVMERVLANADDETTRLALDALVPHGSKAVPRLIYALKRDSLRLHAIYILGRMGKDADGAAGALATFVGDKNSKVATEAALALARIGRSAQTSIPKLLEALDDPHCESGHAIIFALGKFGDAATPAKDALMKRVSDAELGVISAWALMQIQGDSEEIAAAAVPVLVAGLDSPAPENRQLAAESLGSAKMLPPSALAALEKASQDANPSVRNAAAEALKNVREKGSE